MPRHERTLAAILAFSILSTGAHFTHNYVEIDNYPDDLVSGDVVRVAILLTWPLLTAVGLAAYRLFVRGSYDRAWPLLAIYSFTGLSTLGHFLDGSPDIPAFWFATIFTDALAGAAVLWFALWSRRLSPRAPADAARA